MNSRSINEFDYNLPEKLIAQHPLDKRDSSRLLLINKKNQTIQHSKFSNIIDTLNSNDVIVFNDTKVIKSRVICYRKTGSKLEIFFLNSVDQNQWSVMIKNSSRLKINEELVIDNTHKIKIIKKETKTAIIELISTLDALEFLDKYGQTPLPPYIKTENPNQYKSEYQTVFASKPGAVAAPTASLHFSNEIITQLKEKNIDIIYITLHVGLGTFNPITKNNIYEHKMHSENYEINKIAEKKLNHAKMNNKRIIAIGTTVARALESNFNQTFHKGTFSTSLFINPEYKFKAINGLLTNFHLPKSSLLILVCSFTGKDLLLNAYDQAIKNNYRFFSFGDAMLIT